MAAPKNKKHSKKQQPNGTGNHQQPAGKGSNLQGEIAEFASSLGLANGGSQQGFNDSDFRPEKAQKRFKVDTGGGSKQQPQGKMPQQNASRPSAEQALRQTPHANRSLDSRHKQGNGATKGAAQAPGAPPKLRTSREEQNVDSVKGRTWNTGVGPRPGEKRKASLLSRTEPSLWYEAAAGLPALPAEAMATATAAELTESELKARKAVAERALENEAVVFEQELGHKNGQDARWLQQVRRSGTTADKVAALTLLVQESAVANLKALDSLLGWVQKRKGGKDVVRQAIDALREIFVVALLPDRKLRFFEQQPLAAVPAAPQGKEGPRRLLYWLVEDGIKKRYSSFVTALDECSRDNLEFLRERAVKAIYELLRNKAEQESQLLRALVNKLGDPSRKVASNAGFLLASLLQEHPAMKAVVATEVERFVFRPGLKDRAQYYAVIFLNQMVLSHKDLEGGSVLANKLIDIYFTLFKMILEGHAGHAAAATKSQEEAAAAAQPKKNRHRDAPQQGRRGKGKQRGKQAGGRHQKGNTEAPKATAEELDARILGAIIAGVRRAFPFVAGDDVEPLVQRHSDALFRMVHTASFGVAVQALLLLFQLMSAQNSVSDRFYRALYETLLSPEVARSNKAPMFLSLLFKAMQADVSSRRKAAFAKRLLQVSLEQTPAFACGCLLILSELLKAQPSLWSAVQEAEEASDELEHFEDQPEPQEPGMVSDAVTGGEGPTQKEAAALPAAGAGGGKSETLQERSPDGTGARPVQATGYDMRKREPLYAGAEKSAWWELCCLAQHMHPSCSAMACQLLAGTHTDYSGDPLRDHSLVAFLDKFVTRKPKAQQRGASLMQPAAGRNAQQQPSAAAVGSSAFTALAEQDVLPDARFFHKYYSVAAERHQGKPARKRKRDEDAAEDDAASSDEEAEIDDVLEGEEEEEARGGQGYSYDDLAAAMGDDEELLDDGGPSEDAEGSDVEPEAAAAMALGQDSDEFSMEDDSEEDSEASSNAGPDDSDSEADLNPLDLAPATDSDEGDVDEHGLPVIHVESDDSESGEEGWVMYQGPSQQPASVPKRRKAQRPAKGTGAFASADEFLDKIDQDWATTPADDDLEAAPEVERPNRSKRKPKHKGGSKQKSQRQ